MPTYTLAEIEAAVRMSWGADTCYATDAFLAGASADQLARGQCGTTALVLQDLLGGELVIAPVTTHGSPIGHHYWNRLPGGLELDLTREQFRADEELGPAQVVARQSRLPRNGAEAYVVLRDRFKSALEDARRVNCPQTHGR